MEALRAAGLPIGVDDFRAAQDALRLGLQGESVGELRNLLRVLWLTSQEDASLFDHHFDEFIRSTPLPAPVDPNRSARLEKGLTDFELESRSGTKLDTAEESVQDDANLPSEAVDSTDISEEASIQLREGKAKSQVSKAILIRQHDPVRPLELRRSWQRLKVDQNLYSQMEMDLKKTIEAISRKGYFDGPVLRPKRVRSLNLVVLMDRHGSMAPMHDFCDRWQATVFRNLRLRKTATAYFKNCPTENIFLDQQLFDAQPLSRFLKDFSAKRTVVLVITDAGAARQSWNTMRIIRSQELSQKLSREGFQQVWLNPMATEFWEKSSARKIASLVPAMLPMNPAGTQLTIRTLNRAHRKLEV